MAIYVGSQKYKLISNGDICDLIIYSPIPITNGIRLLSSDDYILQDVNGLYLTITDNETYRVKLLSPDDYILHDANGVSIIAYDFEECDMQMSTVDDCILQDSSNLYLTIRKG